MIDTHAHIDFPDFDGLRSQAMERFFKARGEAIIDVGCDMKSSERAVILAKENENIFSAVGIHPHDAGSLTEENLRRLEELLLSYKTVAMGEIGLDFFKEPFCDPKVQEDAFRRQLELAELHQKPIIIHCREAYTEVLEILKGYKTSGWNGVLHCFTASPEVAQEFLDLGFYIGFTGVITYYKCGSNDEFFMCDALKAMPLDKILVETDAPYLSPVPHRGEINEPLFVRYVIEKIAEIRGMDADELEKITSENAKRLFGI
ncbi:MAG: TatD family hydrolase [Candidatus Pacebacteria bacterium]|nr:TatD family hydrolase [Candidatus Paceibacterota bacterium]